MRRGVRLVEGACPPGSACVSAWPARGRQGARSVSCRVPGAVCVHAGVQPDAHCPGCCMPVERREAAAGCRQPAALPALPAPQGGCMMALCVWRAAGVASAAA